MNSTTVRSLTIAALITLPFALAACTPETGGATDSDAPSSDTAAVTQSLSLDSAWAKAADGMSGVFGTLVNNTDEPVTLLSAVSERAGLVELHETAMVDGTSIMREVEGGFEIPAMGTFELVPGGNHIMLMELTSELLPGELLPVSLTFSNGEIIELELDVRDFAGADENYGDLEHGDEHTDGSHE